MGRKLLVAMDDVIDAMNASREDPVRFFLDVSTGSVELVTQEDLSGAEDGIEGDTDGLAAAILEDAERYHEIPRCETRGAYDLMVRFTETVEDEDLRDQLHIALRGKGAFRRFRDVVFRYDDLKKRWLVMKQMADIKEAERWIASLGIEPVYELRPVEGTAATDQSRPEPAQPHMDLMDVLLLGAPAGKTELLGGRVLRQMNCRTESEARAAFKRLARDLCAYFGVPWRKRFVEGTSTFAIERAQLLVDGRTVHLWIEVTPATWQSFSS